jgi:hypothetical protein
MTALKRSTGILPEKLKHYRTGNYLFYIGLRTPDWDTILFKVTKKQVFDELKNIDSALYEVNNLQRHIIINFLTKQYPK